MTKKRAATTEHVHYHKDGTIWAKGQTASGKMTGYWEWFRKDGTKMRTGSFEAGEQVGEWTTYDSKGRVVKVTRMKPKGARATSSAATKSKARARKTKKKVAKRATKR